MNSLFSLLTREILQTEKAISYINKALQHSPDGTLKAHIVHGQTYYSLLKNDPESGGHESYIKNSEYGLISDLAQFRYYKALLPVLRNKLQALYRLKDEHIPDLPQAASKLPKAIASITSPLCFLPNGQPILWKDYLPPQNPYMRENRIFRTKSNDLVRSKSELLIADLLYDNGFLFRYESALYLPVSKKTVYPDFSILNQADGRIMFLEHFGKMDDPEYCSEFIRKKLLYNQNGLYEGTDLIFTFESSLQPLNIRETGSIILRQLDA